MTNATFLLAFNFSIGLSFAVTFLALTRRACVRLGRWCAVGFLSAAATVAVEALAFASPSARLTSVLSFGSLMLALTVITAGLAHHYGSRIAPAWFAGLFCASVAACGGVVYDLPRGTWLQAIGYQGPFALVLFVAAGLVATASPRRTIDRVLAGVLGLSAIQFLTKIVLAGSAGHGPGVRDYIVSTYAFYSQTAGGILSLLLGLSLVGLIVIEVTEETRLRLQRDSLSGLPNRAAFLEQVSIVLRGRAGRAPAIVILADLDRFKSINDRFGHAAGDEVIRAFGAILSTLLADGAVCGRLGGEEFCIVIPDCPPAAAREHLEAIRARAHRSRYARLPADIAVTASFGIALTDPGEPFEEALHRADMALYEAKAAGRDGYRFAAARRRDADADPFRIRSAAATPT